MSKPLSHKVTCNDCGVVFGFNGAHRCEAERAGVPSPGGTPRPEQCAGVLDAAREAWRQWSEWIEEAGSMIPLNKAMEALDLAVRTAGVSGGTPPAERREPPRVQWKATPRSESAMRYIGWLDGIRAYEALWRPDLNPDFPWLIHHVLEDKYTPAESEDDFNRAVSP